MPTGYGSNESRGGHVGHRGLFALPRIYDKARTLGLIMVVVCLTPAVRWPRDRGVRIHQRIEGGLKERPGDPLPLTWVMVAMMISGLAMAVGALRGVDDFLMNVTANLALLGPGLFITNVLARNWRHETDARGKRERLIRLRSEFDWLIDLILDAGVALQGGFQDGQTWEKPVWRELPRRQVSAEIVSAMTELSVPRLDPAVPGAETAEPITFEVDLSDAGGLAGFIEIHLAVLRQLGGNYSVLELNAANLTRLLRTPITARVEDAFFELKSAEAWQEWRTPITVLPKPEESAVEMTLVNFQPLRRVYVYVDDLAPWLSELAFATSETLFLIEEALKDL